MFRNNLEPLNGAMVLRSTRCGVEPIISLKFSAILVFFSMRCKTGFQEHPHGDPVGSWPQQYSTLDLMSKVNEAKFPTNDCTTHSWFPRVCITWAALVFASTTWGAIENAACVGKAGHSNDSIDQCGWSQTWLHVSRLTSIFSRIQKRSTRRLMMKFNLITPVDVWRAQDDYHTKMWKISIVRSRLSWRRAHPEPHVNTRRIMAWNTYT